MVGLAVAAFVALTQLWLPYPWVVISAALVGLFCAGLRPPFLAYPPTPTPGGRWCRRRLAVTVLERALARLLRLARLVV